MKRYQEALEKPLDHIQNQPGFKRNKRISKLIGFFTLGLAILLYGLARPIFIIYLARDVEAIRDTLIVVLITLMIGLFILFFKLFISNKLIKD